MSTSRRPRPTSNLSQTTKAEAEVELPALTETSLSRPTKTPSPWKGRFNFSICILFHILLVVAHAVLVAVGHDGHPVHFVKQDFWTISFYYVVVTAPNVLGKARSFTHLFLLPGLTDLVHRQYSSLFFTSLRSWHCGATCTYHRALLLSTTNQQHG